MSLPTNMSAMEEAFIRMLLEHHSHHGHLHDHTNFSLEPPTKTVEQHTDDRLNGIFSEEDEAAFALFRNAKDWARILDLNRAYLRGEMEITLHYLSPIQDETIPLVPGLLALHDYGIYTYMSQPACFKGPFDEVGIYGNKLPWFQVEQRAYLTFVLPRGTSPGEDIPAWLIVKFLDTLMADDRIFTSIISYDGSCQHGLCARNFELRHNFPDEYSTNIWKEAESKELLQTTPDRHTKLFDFDCPCKLKNVKAKSKVMAQMSPYMVHVLARSWDEIDIQDVVKAAAEKAGLEPIYAPVKQENSKADTGVEEEKDLPKVVDAQDSKEKGAAVEALDSDFS